jgi:hypothetical protein
MSLTYPQTPSSLSIKRKKYCVILKYLNNGKEHTKTIYFGAADKKYYIDHHDEKIRVHDNSCASKEKKYNPFKGEFYIM